LLIVFKDGDTFMLGTQDRWQEDLFVAGPLSSLIPEDHILKQVDKVLDLSWLRDEVKDLYCTSNGRPGEAKTQHGLRRAARRGLANVAIQAYLTAAVINLKRLAAFVWLLFAEIHIYLRSFRWGRCRDITACDIFAGPKENLTWRKAA
jgi:hypothetical protein